MKIKLWYRYRKDEDGSGRIGRKYIEMDKVVSYSMEIVE